MKKSLLRTAVEDEALKREFARMAGIALNRRGAATDGTDSTDQIDTLIAQAARSFGVKPEHILARGRKEPAVTARKTVMVIAREAGVPRRDLAALFHITRFTVDYAVRTKDAAMVEAVLNGQPVRVLLERSVRKGIARSNQGRCACGNLATRRDNAHQWVCDRCRAIEARRWGDDWKREEAA